jgi:hypothetical protein
MEIEGDLDLKTPVNLIVSTVALFGGSPNGVVVVGYETMVFSAAFLLARQVLSSSSYELDSEEYATREEAIAGHAKMVAKYNRG